MFLASSTFHECVRSFACVQLVIGPTNLFSAHVQHASSLTNLFRPRLQLMSDPINLLSDSRVTHVKLYILMVCLRETCEWHEKFVQKLSCHMCVNIKFKLSCTIVHYQRSWKDDHYASISASVCSKIIYN